MKPPFMALLAIAEGGITRTNLFMQLVWKDNRASNTLVYESKELCILVTHASDKEQYSDHPNTVNNLKKSTSCCYQKDEQ